MIGHKEKRFYITNYALDISRNTFSRVEVSDNEAISQSIESILLTGIGERVMFNTFGSFLSAKIFKNIDEESGEKILDKIISTIKLWEKRIHIDEAKCTMAINTSQQSLTLNITYYLLSDGSFGEFFKKIVF